MPASPAAGDMQQASAPGGATPSEEDMPSAPEQAPSTEDTSSQADAWAEQEMLPEQEAPSEEAAEWEPAAGWEAAADEGLPAEGPAARESAAAQEAAFSFLMVQQEVAVAAAQSAVGLAEIVAASGAVSTSTDIDTSGITQNDTLHRALQPQSYSITQEGREVVQPGKDVAPIIL